MHFKLNRTVYYNNPAYKLDFLSLVYSFYFSMVNSEQEGKIKVCIITFKSDYYYTLNIIKLFIVRMKNLKIN